MPVLEMVAALRRPVFPRAISPMERLLVGLGARFDDFMVRLWMRSDRRSDRVDPVLRAELERAHAFYRNPVFLTDPETFFAPPEAPASLREVPVRSLRGGRCVDLAFASDFRPVYAAARPDFARFPENRIARARWWRHDGRGRSTVLCLHGYASGDPRVDGLAFEARQLYRAGLDVLLYTLPFHGARRPRGARKSGEGFFSTNMARTNEAFAQTIYDARALVRYAERCGSGPIGAFGMSLGAYVTALLAALEPQLGFAIAMIPVVSLTDLVWGEPLHCFRRQEIEAHGVTLDILRELWQVHEPLMRHPLVPHERRFVIGALGDRICPPGHAHTLWHHWGRPRVHWYPGGHLAQFRRGRALGEVRSFLGDLGLAA
jgi:pimeloyl-ACP methyl ester carboxylesterase